MPASRFARKERYRAPRSTTTLYYTGAAQNFAVPYGKAYLTVTGTGGSGDTAWTYYVQDYAGGYREVVATPGHTNAYEVGPWYTQDVATPGHTVSGSTYNLTYVEEHYRDKFGEDYYDYWETYDHSCPPNSYSYAVQRSYVCNDDVYNYSYWVDPTYTTTYHQGYTTYQWVDPTYTWVYDPPTYHAVTYPAYNGSPTYFGGVTFPGGIQGPASPLTVNIPVAHGVTTIAGTVASGGSLTIQTN